MAGLKLVPFNPVWVNHSKLDIHAIYLRPRFKEDKYGEFVREIDPATGKGAWDITGPLPLKSHVRWSAKGFQYLTLATKEDLVKAGSAGTIPGDWRQYNQHGQGGPWNYRLYAEGLETTTSEDEIDLISDIDRYGWETVEHLRRRDNPDFRVPDRLKAPIQAAAPEAAAAPVAPDIAKIKRGPGRPPGKKNTPVAGLRNSSGQFLKKDAEQAIEAAAKAEPVV